MGAVSNGCYKGAILESHRGSFCDIVILSRDRRGRSFRSH